MSRGKRIALGINPFDELKSTRINTDSRRGPRVVVHERELPEALALDVRRADLHLLLLPRECHEALQHALLHDVEIVPFLVLWNLFFYCFIFLF